MEYEALINGVEKQALLNKLNEFHKDIEQEEINPKKSFSITRLSVAASLVLIVAMAGFWFYNSTNTNQKLFVKYFSPDPGLPTVMSNNSDFEFFDGMVSYKRAEYQLAIEKWQNLLADKPQNDTLNYFLGVAYLAEKNQLKTIEFLTKVAGDSNSIFFKDANYYLGLAYLKNNDIEKSIQSFNISNTEKSQQIISNLKKKK
jgi:predicted Zn-dependent protease